MFEVFLGDNRQGRHLMSAGSETEAVAFAKSNLFRYGGQTLTVIEDRLDKDSGLYRAYVVWQSKKPAVEPDRERLVEAARYRRKMLR
jgi:hypothetical protein